MSAGSMQVPVGRTVKVRVPATSANLGPGFDTLGLALGFYDELEVTVTPDAGVSVEVFGEGSADSAAPVATDSTNLVVQSIARAFSFAGVDLPGLSLVAHNQIPHSRGMGSSSAAIVSGLIAAKGLLRGNFDFQDEILFMLATELEGHPDNVAPALFGGMTISWTEREGPKFLKLSVHSEISAFVLVPPNKLSTKLARSLQPSSVPLKDAVFNISRSSLLVTALTENPEYLFQATEDKLHQSYRSQAMPQTYNLLLQLRRLGVVATISGAGPSVLVFSTDTEQRDKLSRLIDSVLPSDFEKLFLPIEAGGYSLNICG